MQLINSLVEWSSKRVYVLVPLMIVVAISGIILSDWQQPAENTEPSATALSQANGDEPSTELIDPNQSVATENNFQEISSDAIKQNDLSQRADKLVNQFLDGQQIREDSDYIAAELRPLLDEQGDLLQQLLSREFPSQQQKNQLLVSISYVLDDTASLPLRDYALGLTRSSDHTQAMAGLELLSSMDISIDAEVTQSLLEFGTGTQEPEVLTRVMATLTSESAPETERDSIVEFISEMTLSEDPSIRSQAVQRLAQWDQAGSAGNTLSALSLTDPDPAVRAFSIQALVKTGSVYPEQRDQLFAVVTDPQEDPMVKIAAAEALDNLHLTESDIEIINNALWAEDFQLNARP